MSYTCIQFTIAGLMYIMTGCAAVYISQLITLVAFILVMYGMVAYDRIVNEVNQFCLCNNFIQSHIASIETHPYCEYYC